MERAESAGPRVEATFSVATGPHSHVTGASGIPMARTLVFDEQVDAGGMEQSGRVEGIVPMGQGVGRPFEEPKEE